MGATQRQRLAPEERRVLLLDVAEASFGATGYANSGLAEIAEAAGVSKTLLYHYFPDGRPELDRAVVERLADGAIDALRTAARAPHPPRRRLAGLVDALITFLEAHPGALRLVVLEPLGSGDPTVVGQAVAVRARLAAELAGVLAGEAQPLERTTAAATASLATLLAVCELHAAGTLDGDEARSLAVDLMVGGLEGLDLI